MRSASMNKGLVRLGTYEILRHVADGGMAEIYLARTKGVEGFEKVVILKRILPKLANDAGYVRLFIEEAKLGALLVHPNIAGVYDIGATGGEYFFAMEFVHGQDLRAILRRCYDTKEPMPLPHAVHIARSVAAALHYAHERRGSGGVDLGIVHRDVSPSNVMVSYDGSVKLLDFGVARTATRTMKTRTGSLKGKVSYMSPEQARGAPLDRRSDVFSLGIVLWEMIATRRLFKGGNDLATIHRIVLEDVPAPSSLRPDCPPVLEQIVMRALDRDPTRRFQTAQALELALEELAVELRLKQSPIALASLMSSLFQPELEAWRLAEETGTSLSAHVAELVPEPAAQVDASAEFVPEPDDVDEVVDESEAGDDFDRTPIPVAAAPAEPQPPPVPAAVPPTDTFDDLDDVPPVRVRAIPRSASIAAELHFLDKSRRRMRWIVGLALGALLAIVLIAMRCRHEEKSAPSAPAPQETPPPPPPAPISAPAAIPDAAMPIPPEPIKQDVEPSKPAGKPAKPTRPKPTTRPNQKPKPKWYE